MKRSGTELPQTNLKYHKNFINSIKETFSEQLIVTHRTEAPILRFLTNTCSILIKPYRGYLDERLHIKLSAFIFIKPTEILGSHFIKIEGELCLM